MAWRREAWLLVMVLLAGCSASRPSRMRAQGPPHVPPEPVAIQPAAKEAAAPNWLPTAEPVQAVEQRTDPRVPETPEPGLPGQVVQAGAKAIPAIPEETPVLPNQPALPAAPIPAEEPRTAKTDSSPAPAPEPIQEPSPLTLAAAAAAAPAVDPAARMRELYQLAAERYSTMDSYIVRLRRFEEMGKNDQQEMMLLKFRKEPWSVHMKWIGPVGTGREVLYVKGRHEDKIHTRLAAGDSPFMPAGKRIALSPDNVLVRSKSRHSITEAGIGNLIDKFGAALARDGRQPGGRELAYQGPVKRPEYDQPLEEVVQTLAPRADPTLAEGGRRHWYFDAESKLPVVLITLDARGKMVEYYCYDRFQAPVGLDDDDFDPARLWPAQPGQPAQP